VYVEELKKSLPGKIIIEISAIQGKGIEALENEIVDMGYGGQVSAKDSGLVSNIRHKHLLEGSLNRIEMTLETIKTNLPLELISVDLKDTWDFLGQVTGDTVAEDIIDQIFANFCIGK